MHYHPLIAGVDRDAIGVWESGGEIVGVVHPEHCMGVAFFEADPDYRRKGLGRAAVMEGVRRGGAQGATVAYVGTAKPFYLALGFRQLYNCSVWRREWT